MLAARCNCHTLIQNTHAKMDPICLWPGIARVENSQAAGQEIMPAAGWFFALAAKPPIA